jgi:hypothetical protein
MGSVAGERKGWGAREISLKEIPSDEGNRSSSTVRVADLVGWNQGITPAQD